MEHKERRVGPDRRKNPLDQIALDLPKIASEMVRLRSEVRIAKAAWRFTIIVVTIAIALGGFLLYRINEQSHQREEDRKAFDLANCEAGNRSRNAIREDLVFGVRDVFINLNPEAAADPANAADLAQYNKFFDDIAAKFPHRDCEQLVNNPVTPVTESSTTSP